MTRVTKKAFTVMELMVVVVVVGIMAAFAIPNFRKTMNKSYEDDALTTYNNIKTAQQIYLAQNGTYWPTDALDHPLDEINAALGLSIIANGMTWELSCSVLNGGICTSYSVQTTIASSTCSALWTFSAGGESLTAGNCVSLWSY